MGKALVIIGGVGLGAGLMYFYDPEQGRKRRDALRRIPVEKTAEEAREWLSNVRHSFQSWLHSLREETGQEHSGHGDDEKVLRLHDGKSRDHALPVDTPTARVLTGAAGAALTFFGLRLGSRTGASLAAMGLTLLASSLAGRDLTN